METDLNSTNINEPSQITKKKKVFYYIIMIFITILLTFLISEGVLRIFLNDLNQFSDDKLIRHRGDPYAKVGDFKLNSKGFMDIESPVEKEKGTYRILAIGDSFVYGTVGYEKNFVTLLENYLNNAGSNTGSNFEIINMGIPGTEPPQYHRLLLQEGMSYNPDMVIVFFFVGNDLVLYLEELPDTGKPLFYTFRLIKKVLKTITTLDLWKIYTGKLDEGIVKDRKHFLDRKILNLDKYMTNDYDQSLLVFDPEFSKLYLQSIDPLLATSELCKEKGIEFVVVLIPEDIQVDPGIAEEVLSIYNSSDWNDTGNIYTLDLARKGKYIDFKIPNKALESDLDNLGIQTIDLYDSFANYYATNTDPLYIPFDGHWNVYGNRLAAESLVEPLLNNADIVSFMGNMSKAPSSD